MADETTTTTNVTTTAPPNVPGDGIQPQGAATFTQEQVNAIVADRLRRERDKVSDYEEIKNLSDELKKSLDDSKATLDEKEAALAEFQDKQAQWEQELAARDLKDAIVEAGREAGFRVPSDAFALMDLAEAASDPEKVGELVAALAEARPDLLGTPSKPPATSATQPAMSRQPAPGEETDQQKRQRLGLAAGAKDLFGGGGVILPAGMEE